MDYLLAEQHSVQGAVYVPVVVPEDAWKKATDSSRMRFARLKAALRGRILRPDSRPMFPRSSNPPFMLQLIRTRLSLESVLGLVGMVAGLSVFGVTLLRWFVARSNASSHVES
jgi:hypothetical protein